MYFTVYTAGLAFSAALTASLALVVWREHLARGSREVALLMVAVCIYATGATIEAAVVTAPQKLLWSAVSYLGATTAPVGSLVLALRMVHAGRWLRPRRIALLFVVPLVSIGIAFTNAAHGWLWPGVTLVQTWAGTTALYAHGPWYWVHTIYSYVMVGAGLLVLAGSLRGLAGIYARQNLFVLLAILVPFCGNALYVAAPVLTTGQDLAPILFTITGVLLAIAMRRHRLLRLTPIARTALFEHTVDGILFLTADGRINDVNPAALRMFAIDYGAVGERLDDALREEAVLVAALAGDDPEPGPRLSVDVPFGKGQRWCDVRRVPLRDHGVVRGCLVTVTDVTDRHVAAEQRSRMIEQQELAMHFESLGVMASGVAHDFNNLLTAMLGQAELMLLEVQPDTPAARSAQEIIVAGRRGADLCDRLQAYAGRRPAPSITLDVNTCVRQSIEAIDVPGASDRMCLELDPALPALHLEASALRQLVRVLGVNALEAAPAGPVTVRTRRAHVSRDLLGAMPLAHTALPGEYVAVAVGDQGSGIPYQHATRIFEPFFTTKFHGRGLGLSTALGIVRSHGGALQVTSVAEVGTTVTVYLPVLPSHILAQALESGLPDRDEAAIGDTEIPPHGVDL